MEDADGALSFDFEALDSGPSIPFSAGSLIQSESGAAAVLTGGGSGTGHHVTEYGVGNGGGRRSYRQTVCRHWLRSLCMKGDACGFLHEYDKSRMPVCRFFRQYGECREQDCVYKHTMEDMKECNMYKLGFCPNGPDCRYRHVKLPGPAPPVEEVLQKTHHLVPFNYTGGTRFVQNRSAGPVQQFEKFQSQQDPTSINHNVAGNGSTPEMPTALQQQVQQSQTHNSLGQVQNVSNGQQNLLNNTASPLPQGSSRYFVVKSCNRENLELSAQQGVWATQRSNEAKLNEAFDSVENVILIFSVNRTRHFQGCAKMISKIAGFVGGGNWKYAHGTAHYGRNFAIKWLKLCELSFHKTRYLRNPYNENLPVKISRDCQELEPTVGEQLASFLYLEPDSELMAIWLAAELKREEEAAKGGNMTVESESENPDIVPFDDNDDDEEEESEEEDLSFGRGRGRGAAAMMWGIPQMSVPRGRPHPGVRPFPPMMVGPDGYAYPTEGFGMPDFFGSTGPRMYTLFGPRFPGDMMFPGRPQPYGMPLRPFPAVRPGRPVLTLASQLPRAPISWRDPLSGTEPGDDIPFQQGPCRMSMDDDGVSEDEAPRRSRQGERRKHRGSDDDGQGDDAPSL